jgi:hypothetical protein
MVNVVLYLNGVSLKVWERMERAYYSRDYVTLIRLIYEHLRKPTPQKEDNLSIKTNKELGGEMSKIQTIGDLEKLWR